MKNYQVYIEVTEEVLTPDDTTLAIEFAERNVPEDELRKSPLLSRMLDALASREAEEYRKSNAPVLPSLRATHRKPS